ncbi:MAG: HYExAFE family protein [Proteobacteria bacterium]|nr:HYExAFE family protein [Pseudomonadota bacterium]
MAQRRHHYERAFEAFLRARRMPYVAVDEARKSLLPEGANELAGRGLGALKSFDFVVYGQAGTNLLIDIKGRRVPPSKSPSGSSSPLRPGRLESWVTLEDVQSLEKWQELFGSGFAAAFVFIYWCDAQPPDALFQEIIEYQGAWYALRAVTLPSYKSAMKTRSQRWGTVYVPSASFEHISQPFAPAFGSASSENPASFSEPSTRAGNPVDPGPDWGPELPVLMPHVAGGYHRP